MKDLFGNRQKQAVVVLFLLVAGIVYTTTRPSADSPEGRVRKAVAAMIHGAEQHQIKPFRTYLSDSVRDEVGRNKEEMIRILQGVFLTHRKIALDVLSLDVTGGTNPDVLNVRLNLLMRDSPLSMDRGNFELTFRREGGEWRVWEVVWEDGAVYGE